MFDSRKCERKKIWRKSGRKEKAKEMNINFFSCLVIHGKFKGKKNSFSFVWLTTKKVNEKWKKNKINNLSQIVINLLNNKINFVLLFSKKQFYKTITKTYNQYTS